MTKGPTSRSLTPSPFATILSQTLFREIAGQNRPLVRRTLSAIRKARLLAGDPPVSFDLDGSTIVLPLSHDLPIHRAVHPDYSKNLGAVVHAVAGVRPEATLIDIGANVGDSVAIVRARIAVPVLCIEGDEMFLPYLYRNMASLTDVEVAPIYAASGAPGPARAVVQRSGGSARLVDRDDGQTVSAQDLAGILATHPAFANPTVIKIDTDGHDASILRAACSLLVEAHPVLFFEHDPAIAEAVGAEDPVSVFGYLVDLGYAWFVVYANTGAYLGHHSGADINALADRTRQLEPGSEVPYLDICAIHGADPDLFAVILASAGDG